MFPPQLEAQNELSFVNNIATYGPDIASFPSYLELPTDQEFANLASGQTIAQPLVFRLLAFQRNLVSNDNSSTLTFFQKDGSAGQVSGTTTVLFSGGVANFSDLQLTAPPPSSQVDFEVNVQSIDHERVAAALSLDPATTPSYDFLTVKASFRHCEAGEY